MIGGIGELIMGIADASVEIKRGFERVPSPRPLKNRRSSSRASPRESVDGERQSAGSSAEPSEEESAVAPAASQSAIEGTGGRTVDESERASLEKSTGEKPGPAKDSTESSRQMSEDSPVKKDASDRKPAKGTRLPAKKVDLDDMISAGKATAKAVNAGLKVPTAFTLAVARGFHNVPLLYGDDTVRETEKITGIKSGLKAAGKVCSQGLLYDVSH
jgi:hypothetical protein